jgi:phytoene dehydrogenase-like protein
MSNSYDVIIIGGGHNGLVAAAYLAKAGLKTIVFEKRPVLGGAAATEEIYPGFMANSGAPDAGLFSQAVISDLKLPAFDLKFLESPALATTILPEGRHMTLWRDSQRTIDELREFSEEDAIQYSSFVSFIQGLARGLAELLGKSPPPIPDHSLSTAVPWLQLGLKLRCEGGEQMMTLIRTLPLPIRDLLDEWFENQELKGMLAVPSITGGNVGPYQAGTALMFLYQNLGRPGGAYRSINPVEGGVGRLSESLAAAARSNGAEIRVGAGVANIMLDTDGDAVTGTAPLIVPNCDPRRTFFQLIGGVHLTPHLVREIKNIRYQGTTARINLCLSDLPSLISQIGQEEFTGHIVISPDMEYIEKAADDAKYGRLPQSPVLEIVVPTLLDPQLAPENQHIMSITCKYAPYNLEGKNWDEEREALGDLVVSTLAKVLTGLPELILHRQVLTPLDLEREYGLTEGSVFHGQMGMDQLYILRPLPGYARYQTPFGGLYLCGAGTHPGGGVTGLPGRNAALEILKDRRRT